MSTEKEDFIDIILTKLNDKIDNAEDLKTIKTELSISLSNYDMTQKESSIKQYNENELPLCYEVFLATKRIEGRTEETLNQYKYQIEKFLRWVKKPVEEINREDIILYLYTMKKGATGKELSCVSVDNIRLCLNSFFNWANQNGYISKNPVAAVGRIKGDIKQRQPLNEMDVEKIRDTISTYKLDKANRSAILIRARDLALFEFLYSTGCRVSEVINVKKEDIDYSSKPPCLTVYGKGKKYRETYLNAKAVYAINKYLSLRTDSSPYLFVYARAPYNKLTAAGIESTFKKYQKITDIHIYPHRIRHTMATQGLKHGMSVPNLQTILGHENSDTTMIYAHLANDDIKYQHNKYIN